ncbi:MAG: hypothetical protein EBW52_06790 [Betaproteobacteria bacterium]|nr:hypothetical protein [Betaproteobacteria bacterium]
MRHGINRDLGFTESPVIPSQQVSDENAINRRSLLSL